MKNLKCDLNKEFTPGRMCTICKHLIYDTIISPLSVNSILRPGIHQPSLVRCAQDLTDHLYRAVKGFPLESDFFIRVAEPFRIYTQYENDQFIWHRFHERYPEEAKELDLAVHYCIDQGIARATHNEEQLITDFLMLKFRSILHVLPEIHDAHTKKLPPPPSPSLGPVPTWKINLLRQKAGLSLIYEEQELPFLFNIQINA